MPANRYSLRLNAKPKVLCITINALPAPPTDNKKVSTINKQYYTLNSRFVALLRFKSNIKKVLKILIASIAQVYTLVCEVYCRFFI